MTQRHGPGLFTALVIVSALLPSAARAADRCGGITLAAGVIRTGKVLTPTSATTADGKGCLEDVVRELDRHRLVRAVTVAAIVSDAERVSGKGLADAKAVAGALIAAGFPKNRVFSLSPAPQRPDELGLFLRYVERAPEDVVARIAAVSGAVFVGADDGSLKPAEAGMPVLLNELVKTGPGAKASIHFKDGSAVSLQPDTKVKLPVLQMPTGGDRRVKIEVLSGGITADVRKASQQASFEASSRVSVASVRGTLFRLNVNWDKVTRVETIRGRVAVGSAIDKTAPMVDVTAGTGTVVSADGRLSPAQALPATPQVIGPLKGALPKDARFSWQPLVDAASYQFELARDADFIVDLKVAEVRGASLSWPSALPPGKWFWRVTAVDSNGFAGAPSKVYAVTVGK